MEDIYKKYIAFIKELNRAGPVDDEYDHIAAYEAFASEYHLDHYPTPPIELRRKRAGSHVARLGGAFASMEGREPPCRE